MIFEAQLMQIRKGGTQRADFWAVRIGGPRMSENRQLEGVDLDPTKRVSAEQGSPHFITV
jgi:hypothetical protein